jgi:hypothetical protein
MTARDFCYWLKGYFELKQTIDHREGATPETMSMIEKHLDLVFTHEIDPSFPADQQEALNTAHNGNSYTGMRC